MVTSLIRKTSTTKTAALREVRSFLMTVETLTPRLMGVMGLILVIFRVPVTG
jgi:hypothetical protein